MKKINRRLMSRGPQEIQTQLRNIIDKEFLHKELDPIYRRFYIPIALVDRGPNFINLKFK